MSTDNTNLVMELSAVADEALTLLGELMAEPCLTEESDFTSRLAEVTKRRDDLTTAVLTHCV